MIPSKNSTTLAFINADWRDFQNKPAAQEIAENSIMVDDYLKVLERTGWRRTHIIQSSAFIISIHYLGFTHTNTREFI